MISIHDYRVRVGMFYGRAIKLKGMKCFDFVFVMFINLILIFQEKSIPIVLLYLHMTCMHYSTFHTIDPTSVIPHYSNPNNLHVFTPTNMQTAHVISKILSLSGDIHPNPGPVHAHADSPNISDPYSTSPCVS